VKSQAIRQRRRKRIVNCLVCKRNVEIDANYPLVHVLWAHHTHFLPDDSVWCLECQGVVAVADG
jgi:hypothetical protein